MTNSRSFYAGPRRDRLTLNSWAEVVTAADGGLLDETSWVELKLHIPPSNKQANRELACDLASLSVDGGLLIIGIADKNGKAGEVRGTTMQGLADRIAQVAVSIVSPSLPIQTCELRHPSDGGRGVLVVAVPASEIAPHMVDGSYWGRGDQGKRRLSDPEVARLFQFRRGHSEDLAAELAALSSDEFDPIPLADRKHGHVYLIFRPAAKQVGLELSAALGRAYMPTVAREAIRFEPKLAPSLFAAANSVGHPKGLRIDAQAPGSAVVPERYVIRLQVHDDGVVQVVSGAGTRAEHVHFPSDEPRELINHNHIMELTHSVVMFVGHLASNYMGYWGPWRIGLRITRLAGLQPYYAASPFWHGTLTYPEREYQAFAYRSAQDLSDAAAEVVADLLRPFLRGLGLDRDLLPYEEPQRIGERLQW